MMQLDSQSESILAKQQVRLTEPIRAIGHPALIRYPWIRDVCFEYEKISQV
jgi:hypothetical protein